MSDRVDWWVLKIPVNKKLDTYILVGPLYVFSISGWLESRGFTKRKSLGWMFTARRVNSIIIKEDNLTEKETQILVDRSRPVIVQRIFPAIETKAADPFGGKLVIKNMPRFPN